MSKNIYIGTCSKCQKSFSKEIKWGYTPKYCSRTCANSKTKSGPVKRKFKYTKVTFRPCNKCGEILVLGKPKNNILQQYCKICSLYLKNIYTSTCRFNLSPILHSELYDNKLLSKFYWFHPTYNKNGVCWDHLYRITDGFKAHIDPKYISHPANAEMILMKDNIKRRNQSTIGIEELFLRIKLWDSGCRKLPKNW